VDGDGAAGDLKSSTGGMMPLQTTVAFPILRRGGRLPSNRRGERHRLNAVPTGVLLSLVLLLSGSVNVALAQEASPDRGCRSGHELARVPAAEGVHVPDPEIDWLGPEDRAARAELDQWCRAVGPPVLHEPDPEEDAEAVAVDELVVIAWNTDVGSGELDALVEDLRSGRLTGAPVSHFVLLLQEVYRIGDPIPLHVRAPTRSADRIGSALGGDRKHGAIDQLARRHGLHLFYAPSMRNGHPLPDPGEEGGDPPEDRGNAILSTLPLTNLQVVELPVRKQRRIAVAATVKGRSPGGETWNLRVVSVHLDHISPWRRLHRSLGADRAEHAERLVRAFSDEDRIVLGGDFNSWLRGNRDQAVRLLREHFPAPGDPPDKGTLALPVLPLNRIADHLFFRLPDGWSATYEVIADWYGSDHRPLVGRVRTGGADPLPVASDPVAATDSRP
jgi:endonuclease/exonuclease/phosphatase family metal-dependent hydrolase